MQSEVTKKSKNEEKFPKLMNSKCLRFIILATKKNNNHIIGTVVSESEYWPIGQYSESWAKSSFEDFHGEVKLISE